MALRTQCANPRQGRGARGNQKAAGTKTTTETERVLRADARRCMHPLHNMSLRRGLVDRRQLPQLLLRPLHSLRLGGEGTHLLLLLRELLLQLWEIRRLDTGPHHEVSLSGLDGGI